MKQPQPSVSLHPLGMGIHAGGRLQHPAHRPVMQSSPALQVLVPHGIPPSPAPAEPPLPPAPAPPSPPVPAVPPLCVPPPPWPAEPERPPAFASPDPPPPAVPPLPELPPASAPPIPVFPPDAPPAPGDPPIAEPPPPVAPELPPAADASTTLLLVGPLFSFDAHAEIKATAIAGTDQEERVVLMSASAIDETPSLLPARSATMALTRVAGCCTRRVAERMNPGRTRASSSTAPRADAGTRAPGCRSRRRRTAAVPRRFRPARRAIGCRSP